MEIIIGSNNELPEIPPNDDDLKFYIRKLTGDNLYDIYKKALNCNFYYEPLSFMGCGCGLCYGDWSKNNPNEEHDKRVNDIKSLINYLRNNIEKNDIKIIAFNYDDLPDKFDRGKFNINNVNDNEFDWEENVIMQVVAE